MTEPAITVSEAENIIRVQKDELVAERQRQAKEERRRRFDWDVRGFLAITTLIGFFAVVFIQLASALLQGSSATAVRVPAEVAGTVMAVIGYYFGSKSNGRSN